MGCCSSNRSTKAHSPENTTDLNKLESQSTTASTAQNRLAQHQDIITHEEFEEDEEEEEDDDIPISGAFARNKSIQNEIMRLHGFEAEQHHEQHNEIKSNENSEHEHDPEHNHSFAEFTADSVQVIDAPATRKKHSPTDQDSASFAKTDEQDRSHPFGLIQSDKAQNNNENTMDNLSTDEDSVSKSMSDELEAMADLEALYEENLKQQGFDADKFRSANLSVVQQTNTNDQVGDMTNGKEQRAQRSVSVDVSSFASSQLSSSQSKWSEKQKDKVPVRLSHDSMEEYQTDKFSENDDDDLMMQELKMSQELKKAQRQRSMSWRNPIDQNNVDTSDEEDNDAQQQEGIDGDGDNYVDYDEAIGYIENFKESVIENKREIGNIMDDEDEELMNAILSLGN